MDDDDSRPQFVSLWLTVLGLSYSLPGLPTELIRLILEQVFLRPTPDEPKSDKYPLRNTTHILLVSKAFYQLAQEFFLHSITISRPKDFVTFFGRDTGIFSGVHEVSLVAHVYPPVRNPYTDDRNLLAPLAFPTGNRRISRVCILDGTPPKWVYSPASLHKWATRVSAHHVMSARTAAPAIRAAALARLYRSYLNHFPHAHAYPFWEYLRLVLPRTLIKAATKGLDERVERAAVDYAITEDTRYRVELQQAAWLRDLAHVMLPVVWVDRISEQLPEAPYPEEIPPVGTPGTATLVLHARRGSNDITRWLMAIEYAAMRLACTHVHLKRYSVKFISHLLTAIEKAAAVFCGLERVHRWTWEARDGKTYELEMAYL
jgi:hypothetical protein